MIVLVIEPNLDVIKTADWVIDLGPEGGPAGGRIVAEGPPEVVARVAESHTGRFLAQMLGITPEPEAPAPVAPPTTDGANGKPAAKRAARAKAKKA